MSDLIGYTRNSRPLTGLKNSELAVITIGDRQLSLASGFDMNFTQQVRPLFVLGDSSVHYVNGYQEGRANLSRMSGDGNFFEAFGARQCGIVEGMSLLVDGDKPCLRPGSPLRGVKGSLRFSDGVIESLSLRLTAGQTEIQESAAMRFAVVTN